MKRWLFVIAVIALNVFGQEPERIGRLSSKVILKNANGYFLLSDGTFWKAIPFITRWRGPIEWWNGIELVPKNYECIPKDWPIGAEIAVFSKVHRMAVNESSASNQNDLRQCTHLLVNLHTEQIVYGVQLTSEDCICKIYDDAYNDGYAEGSDQSYHRGYCDGKTYGYSDGYNTGYQAAQKNCEREP